MSEVPASCLAWDEDLSALIDEELPAEREAELRAHLDACARCARRLEELCNVDLALAGVTTPEAASDLRERLTARIAAEADKLSVTASPAAPTARARTAPPLVRPRWTAARLVAAGAAAAALLLAAWLSLRSDAPLQLEPPIARAAPEPALDPEPPVEMAEVGLPELADLEEEDVALLVELEAVEDFDVIANLELLERLLDAEAAGGAG